MSADAPRTTNVDKALLNRDEAANYLNISLTSLKEITSAGWLPVVVLRRGNKRDLRRWSRASLDRFIAAHEQGGRLLTLVEGVERTRRGVR
jgi:hypothetical protein